MTAEILPVGRRGIRAARGDGSLTPKDLGSITPRSLIANFGDTVLRMFERLASFFGWAVDYILGDAVSVVPSWLVVFLLDRIRTKRGS